MFLKAKDILKRVEQSRVEARRAAQGETGTLSIGCFAGSSFLFLPELIQAYRTRHPGVRIHLHDETISEQLESLEFGRIDLAFTRPLPRIMAGRFVQERVYRDYVMAVLPVQHALARLGKIRLEKLANEDWVLLRRSSAPESVDGFTALCRKAGFSPRVISEPIRMRTVLMTVASGIGVALSASCFRSFHQPGVTFIPIQPDPPPLDLVAARPKGDPPPTVAAFLAMLRERLPQIRNKYAYHRRRIGTGAGHKVTHRPGLLSRYPLRQLGRQKVTPLGQQRRRLGR